MGQMQDNCYGNEWHETAGRPADWARAEGRENPEWASLPGYFGLVGGRLWKYKYHGELQGIAKCLLHFINETRLPPAMCS